MVIFHSYVSLPEGNYFNLKFGIEPDFTEQILFDACGMYIYIYRTINSHWLLVIIGLYPGTVGKTMP